MKKWKWIGMAMACAVGMVAFTSCDDDDNDDYARVPDAVTAAFSHQYGNPGYVEWDSERGGYYVAEFRKDGRDHEAWYTHAGLWAMTEVDYGRSLADLPQAVQSGYAATAYALDAWTVDDIDEIQRPDYETVYKIEVEKRGQADHDLYFDLGGTLYRDVEGSGSGSGNGGMIQQGMPAEVKAYVDSAFAGAAVVDFDIEDNGMIEVDLRHRRLRVGDDQDRLQPRRAGSGGRRRSAGLAGGAHRRLRLCADRYRELLSRGHRQPRPRPQGDARRTGDPGVVRAAPPMDG